MASGKAPGDGCSMVWQSVRHDGERTGLKSCSCLDAGKQAKPSFHCGMIFVSGLATLARRRAMSRKAFGIFQIRPANFPGISRHSVHETIQAFCRKQNSKNQAPIQKNGDRENRIIFPNPKRLDPAPFQTLAWPALLTKRRFALQKDSWEPQTWKPGPCSRIFRADAGHAGISFYIQRI